MTNNELNEVFAKLAIAQANTEVQFSKTEAQMAKTDATLERMGIHLGDITENNGSTAEDYFYNSLLDNPVLGGVKYDSISKNLEIKSKRSQGEFDIVMFNGESIALIECKYKAHKSDVEKLIYKKVDSFKNLFPVYANYKFYLGIASFSFYPDLENFAIHNGIAILKQKGEVFEIEANNLKAY